MNQPHYPDTWQKRSFYAMGCQMAIWLEHEDPNTADKLLQEAENMFRHAEGILSRFDPGSELSHLNAWTGSWIPVSEMVWSVTTQALFMARETGGLFDPTQLSALEKAGYTRSFEFMGPVNDNADDGQQIEQYGQWQTVQLNAADRSIWLPPDVKLDLGGIAKGYTAQQVVNFLSEWGPCLVDGGGDLTAGSAPLGWPGWPVAIAAPLSEYEQERTGIFNLWLVDGTMATSGIDYRHWLHNGRPAHHIIDPRTSLPAETDLLTVTVLAKTAVRAEAWATAALVAGTAAALEQIADKHLATALVDKEGNLSLTPALAPFLTETHNATITM